MDRPNGLSGTGNRRNIPKSAPVFATLGALDELDAALALAGQALHGEAADIANALRRDTAALRAELDGGARFATKERVAGLQNAESLLRGNTKGGNGEPLPALLAAKAVAHRAERALVAQKMSGGVTPDALAWLDTLATALDALAHFAAGGYDYGTPPPPAAPADGGFMAGGLALCHSVMAEARRRNMRVVCAACDAGGNLAALLREDGAYIASIDIAINKAWTSASLQMPTEALETLAATDGELYGIQFTNANRVVIFAGGIPLYQNGLLVGGFGVSGGSAAEDKDLAHFADQAWKSQRTGTASLVGKDGL